jgi:hypothetical protein
VTVPDGDHLDPFLLDAKQHGVRESTKQRRVNAALVGGKGDLGSRRMRAKLASTDRRKASPRPGCCASYHAAAS